MDKRITFGLIIFFVLYFLAKYISGFYIDYEWFRINEGLQVFWVMFMTKFNVQAIFGALFIFLFLANFILIRLIGEKGDSSLKIFWTGYRFRQSGHQGDFS